MELVVKTFASDTGMRKITSVTRPWMHQNENTPTCKREVLVGVEGPGLHPPSSPRDIQWRLPSIAGRAERRPARPRRDERGKRGQTEGQKLVPASQLVNNARRLLTECCWFSWGKTFIECVCREVSTECDKLSDGCATALLSRAACTSHVCSMF